MPFYVSEEKFGYWQEWPADADGAASCAKLKAALEARGVTVEVVPVVERWMRITNFNQFKGDLDWVLANVDKQTVKKAGASDTGKP